MVRFDWIDCWKGLLIVLVVAGHVVGGASHLCIGASQKALVFLYKVIYLFHMPAFFWLAGLCWRAKNDEFVMFAVKKSRRLLVPYAVFGIFSVLAYVILMRGALFSAVTTNHYQGMGEGAWWQPFASLIHAGGWPNGEGFRCNSVLWFLPAMFSVTCFYWIVDRCLKSRTSQLCLVVLLLGFEFINRRFGLVPTLPFGLSYIPLYGSFLILGRWLRIEKLSVPGWVVALGWLVFGALAWMEPDCYWGYMRAKWYAVFLLMSIMGIALSLWTAKALSGRWLISFGTASLGIMLLHKFVILALQVKLPYVSRWADNTMLFWAANLIILAVTVGMSWLATIVIRKVAPWSLGEYKK